MINKPTQNKNDIIKVKREKELTKKIDPKLIQNILEVQSMQSDLSTNDPRHTTAPNKNGQKSKKNYKHLKITAKNKDLKDISSSNVINKLKESGPPVNMGIFNIKEPYIKKNIEIIYINVRQ